MSLPARGEGDLVFPGTWAAGSPGRIAALDDATGSHLTYGELDDHSRRLANVFADAGLRPGDGVALVSDNDLRVFEVYWAALRSGLYITSVNHHLTPDEAAYIVTDSGAKVVVVAAAKADLAAALIERTPAVMRRLAFGGAVGGHDDYEASLASADPHRPEREPAGTDMLYSSGTTGRPKGIRPPLPTRAVDEPGDALTALLGGPFGLDDHSVYLSPAPLYHAAPLRWCAGVQALGGTVVVMPRFDPHRALEAIAEHGVTHSQWVPTMFIRMLKLDAATRAASDVSSMRVAVHAAAPCPADVKRAMIEWWGPIIYEYYAGTEGNGITLIGPEEALARPGSVGRAVLGTLHVCAEDGTELPPGEVGAIYFESATPAFEYHGDAGKTAGSRHPAHANWSTIGDLGHLDEDGYLFIADRKDFMIITGGVNIYPQEIEDAMALHPGVLDVAVVGVPDDELGEIAKAFVLPAPGAPAGAALEEELRQYLAGRLARFKIPRAFAFVTELPRSPTGKLMKRQLRDAPTPAP